MGVNKLSVSAKKSEFIIKNNNKQIKQWSDNIKCEINGEHPTAQLAVKNIEKTAVFTVHKLRQLLGFSIAVYYEFART